MLILACWNWTGQLLAQNMLFDSGRKLFDYFDLTWICDMME